MVKTYVFGHKSPDSDSITSSIVMANLENKLGNADAKAYRLGNINKETEFILNYLDIDAPELLENVEDGSDVILVDHNSPAESIDNLDNVNILKVVDHHKLALETSYPLFLRFEPVGCSETILCKLYEENGVEITKEIATLMLSAIISDTLRLKSPTTTEDDRIAVEKLAKIADIDYKEYALNMFKAGSSLKGKTKDEIINTDLKVFKGSDTKFAVAQIFTLDIDSINEELDEYLSELNNTNEKLGCKFTILFATDVIKNGSYVIYTDEAKRLLSRGFNIENFDQMTYIDGLASRKKQMVPTILNELEV